MKIAILMLMHKYSEQQKSLIEHLSSDFDVFIHVDRRTSIDPKDVVGPRVHVYKTYDVYWGSFNQIRATALLLKEANRIGYDRYSIISGEDIPLKSNLEIIQYFQENTKEYYECSPLPRPIWGGEGGFERIDYFYPDSRKRGNSNQFQLRFSRFLDGRNERILIPLMRRLGLRRRLKLEYFGGTNWMDLTRSCVSQLVEFIENNPGFLRSFRFTRCADEIFFHTVIGNFLQGIDVENQSLRAIDWTSGPETPRIYRVEDIPRLEKSDCLFARKFDQAVDAEIVEEMFRRVKSAEPERLAVA